jgi:hypothetical protein
MRNPQGYACITGPDQIKQYDTFTCFHCNAIVHVKPMADPSEIGALCKTCMKLICAQCSGQGCTPFLKKIEEMEARHRRSF